MLDFYEAGSGEKYALVFTEESPIPSVVQNGRLFVVKFNANWLQTWAREIKGAGSASFEFSKIETDAAGRIYCFFFDGSYHINCIHPDGSLIWSRSISSGILANGLSGTIIGDFELDPAGQDLIVAIFAALARETYFFRFNRSDGNLSKNTNPSLRYNSRTPGSSGKSCRCVFFATKYTFLPGLPRERVG